MSRKPRADSKLKTLSPDRQADIAAYARDHSLQETIDWLRQDGVQTSLGSLSEFLSWYALAQQLMRNESTVETLLERFKQSVPSATAEQLQVVGQSFFSALALQQQDAKSWNLTQQTQIKREQLALDRQKFQRDSVALFIRWAADEEAKTIATSNVPNAEKTERLGQRLFGELWK